MTCKYEFSDVQRRYSLGIDHATGRHFLSFIFRTYKCNYEEFYVLTPAQFLAFQSEASTPLQFAAAMQVARTCEFGEPDTLLIKSVMAGCTEPMSMAPEHSIEIDEIERRRRLLGG